MFESKRGKNQKEKEKKQRFRIIVQSYKQR